MNAKEIIAMFGIGGSMIIAWIFVILGVLAAKVWVILKLLEMFGVI